MPDRDYSHRDVVDKLGIKPGHLVAFDETAGPLDAALCARVLTQTGRDPAEDGAEVDVALVMVTAATDHRAVLAQWRPRLTSVGGIWLLSPKRGQPGYLDQRLLIEAAYGTDLVDNKVCSVSETISAIRFVIRKQARR